MAHILETVLILCGFSSMVLMDPGTETFSYYEKREILQNTCFDNPLKTLKARRVVSCSMECTQDLNCRRYLFCSSDSSCRLYQDGTDCILSGDSSSCSCYRKRIGCANNNCTCPFGFYGDNCENVIQDCSDATPKGLNLVGDKGLTYIKPIGADKPKEIFCYLLFGGGTQFLNRDTSCQPENFNRTMNEYEEGFGKVHLESWIGLKLLYQIMAGRANRDFYIQISLVKQDWSSCDIFCYNFILGDAGSGYTFNLHAVASTCGDSLTGTIDLKGRPFSTYDADSTGVNRCAARLGGGWWFADDPGCTRGFLTGTLDGSGTEIFWLDDLLDEKFKVVSMKLF